MRKLYFVLAFVGLISAVSNALPSYIVNGTMTWQRGDDGSTWQEWEFTTPAQPALPENYSNNYGIPSINFTGNNRSIPFGWKNGVWQGDPIFALVTIPNSPIPNPFKIVFFEMKYKAVDMLPPFLSAGPNFSIEPFYANDIQPDMNQDWRIMTLGWIIRPNPTVEWIDFALEGTGGFVDYIYIDTICAPEPATLVIFGLGMAAVGLIKKKKAS